MKFLVVTKLEDNAANIYLDYVRAISNLSPDIFVIDYFEVALEEGLDALESQILGKVNEGYTHLFMFIPSGDLTFNPEFLWSIKKKIFIVMNFFDSEYFFEVVDRYYAQAAHLVLTTDYISSFKFRQLGIKCIAVGALYDSACYSSLGIVKDIPVSFIGNINQSNRREYLEFLSESGVDVQCFGTGSVNGFLTHLDMLSILKRSRISINFSGMFDFSHYSLPLPSINMRGKQFKGRCTEIALSGAVLVSENFEGSEFYYQNNVDALYFDSKEELLRIVQCLLSDEGKIESFAKNSTDVSVARFDLNSVFAEIVANHLDSAAVYSSNDMFYVDKSFLRSRRSYLVYYSFYGFLSGSFKNIFNIFPAFLFFFKYDLRQVSFLFLRALSEVSLKYPFAFKVLRYIKIKCRFKSRY